MILIIYSRKFKAKLVRIFPSQLITNATSISCLLGYSRQRTGILLNGGIFLSYELLCMMSESGSSSMTKAIEPMPAESETVLNFVPLSIRGTGNMMVL